MDKAASSRDGWESITVIHLLAKCHGPCAQKPKTGLSGVRTLGVKLKKMEASFAMNCLSFAPKKMVPDSGQVLTLFLQEDQNT